MNIKWMRRGAQRITHAFREAEVERFDAAIPLGLCGEFPVADLVEDSYAAKCTVCQRAVRRIDLEQRQTALKTRVCSAVRPVGTASSVRATRSAS